MGKHEIGFPGDSVVKNPPASVGYLTPIWVGMIPGERNGNPFQYPCLGNPMERESWQATVPGVTRSLAQLNN